MNGQILRRACAAHARLREAVAGRDGVDVEAVLGGNEEMSEGVEVTPGRSAHLSRESRPIGSVFTGGVLDAGESGVAVDDAAGG